jgi:hypothetical protein
MATKVEMYINLKTAKALGITVPLPLSGRANELFEWAGHPALHESAYGTKRTSNCRPVMSAIGGKADVAISEHHISRRRAATQKAIYCQPYVTDRPPSAVTVCAEKI